MPRFFCEQALLPDGWADRVLLDVDEQGAIRTVSSQAKAGDATCLTGVVLPGVPNLHSHAHQRAIAGLTERAGHGPDSFWTWRELMYRCLQQLTPDDLQAIAAQLYVEMLRAGFTAVAEFQYLHHAPDGTPYDNTAEMTLRTLAAARETGIGVTCLPVLYAYRGFGSQAAGSEQRRFIHSSESFARLLDSLLMACAGNANTRVGMAPHSLRAVDQNLLSQTLDWFQSSNFDAPIHIHIAEQIKEVEDCLSWSGLRPVEWLYEHFPIGSHWCLIHATHMNQAEVEQVAGSGAVVGLCPTTEANLGDGLFNAVDYLATGGRIGIGSDSHCSVSPVEELRWLEYGQRLLHRRRNLLAGGAGQSTGRRLFESVLSGGKLACGRAIGAIASGYRADLIVLDASHPRLYGRQHDTLLDSWLFSGNENPIDAVIVGGRIVIEGGRHAEESRIRNQFQRTISRLQLRI